MTRSVFSGIVAGAFVSAVGLGTASLIAPQLPGREPPADPAQGTLQGQAPQPSAAPAPVVAGEGPAVERAAPPAPVAADDDPSVEQTGAQPAPVEAPSGMLPDVSPPAEDAVPAPSASDTAIVPPAQLMAPVAPLVETTPPGALIDSAAPVQPLTPPSGEERAPAGAEGALVPDFAPSEAAAPVAPPAVEPGAGTPETASAALPRVRNTVGDRPSTFAPTPSLIDREASASAPDQLGALDRFAEPAVLTGAPLFSVVLIDDARMGLGAAAVAALPMPVTMAVSPTVPNATDRMRSYRAAGIEVVALSEFPAGTDDQQAHVVLESTFATLPEAIALMDVDHGGIGSVGGAASVAAQRLASDGRGVVLPRGGLGGLARATSKQGVPGQTIYRDLDGDGQALPVIRRLLDQAAFRARTEGQVVVMGRLRPDTLSALDLWGLSDRAGSVDAVPLSAQLRGDD